jgi:hypothetical protein
MQTALTATQSKTVCRADRDTYITVPLSTQKKQWTPQCAHVCMCHSSVAWSNRRFFNTTAQEAVSFQCLDLPVLDAAPFCGRHASPMFHACQDSTNCQATQAILHNLPRWLDATQIIHTGRWCHGDIDGCGDRHTICFLTDPS